MGNISKIVVSRIKLEKFTFLKGMIKHFVKTGYGLVTRKAIASTKPNVVIQIDGDKWTIEQISNFKTFTIEFNLDEVTEYDPGSGTMSKYINTLEGDKLVTKLSDSNEKVSERDFFEAGFIQTYFSKNGVIATRTWRKEDN